jgi:hypothetical protein
VPALFGRRNATPPGQARGPFTPTNSWAEQRPAAKATGYVKQSPPTGTALGSVPNQSAQADFAPV